VNVPHPLGCKVFVKRDKITIILEVFQEFAPQILEKPCTLKGAVHSTQLTLIIYVNYTPNKNI